MSIDVNLTVTGTVESLRLAPGDRILVTLDEAHLIPAEQIERIATQLRRAFPDNEVVLLSGLRIAKEQAA